MVVPWVHRLRDHPGRRTLDKSRPIEVTCRHDGHGYQVDVPAFLPQRPPAHVDPARLPQLGQPFAAPYCYNSSWATDHFPYDEGMTLGVSQGPVINSQPRPRVLVKGFTGEPELIERLLAQGATSRYIGALREVRQDEWDVLVTDGLCEPLDRLCVIFRRPIMRLKEFGDPRLSESGFMMTWRDDHVAGELRRAMGLPPELADLVHEQLEPVLTQRPTHEYVVKVAGSSGGVLGGGRGSSGASRTPSRIKFELEGFIYSGANEVLAGRYRRSETSEAWLLPSDTPDLVVWLRAALREWHTLAPDRFPGVPDWSHEPKWSTGQEADLRRRLAALADEREKALIEFDEREQALKGELADASEEADRYERTLLTGQGESLRIAVMRALEELGLIVTDADAEADDRDDLEDLRVEDVDAPGWLALVEVKGYSKGAKTEAMTQFLRFIERFHTKSGRLPDAKWYIVNQFLARDPSTRQRLLHGSPGDVDTFARSGGLVLDTRVLFRLLLDVRAGDRDAAAVRDLLRSTKGLLELGS